MLHFCKYIAILLLASCVAHASHSQQTVSTSHIFDDQFVTNVQNLRDFTFGNNLKYRFLQDSMYSYIQGADSGDWILDTRQKYNYDKQGLRVQSLSEKFTDNSWVSQEKIVSTYDKEYRLVKNEISTYNSEEKFWKSDRCKYFGYNSVGLLSETLTQNCQTGDPLTKELRQYNALHKIVEEKYLLWNQTTSSWYNSQRMIYSYDDDQNTLSETLQLWVDSLDSWQNEERTSYDYDEEDQLIQVLRNVWNDSQTSWTNVKVIELIYNEQGQVESYNQLAVGEDGGYGSGNNITEYVASYNYNSDGNTHETIFGSYDKSKNEWLYTQKKDYFWSKYLLGNLSSDPSEIGCNFSNPHKTGGVWNCESLKESEIYTLSVVDLKGVTVHSQKIYGNSPFIISAKIPQGLHLVIIQGRMDKYAVKVLFDN